MTKLVKFCAAVVLIGVCTGGAFAQDRTEAAQAAVKDMARETVECAVYFDIVSLCCYAPMSTPPRKNMWTPTNWRSRAPTVSARGS